MIASDVARALRIVLLGSCVFSLVAIQACADGSDHEEPKGAGGLTDGGAGSAGDAGGSGGADAGGTGGGPATCGNTIVEDGEDCDDGNTTPGDGCEPSCAFTCVPGPGGNATCSDFLPCNGTEVCRADHTCAAGTPLPSGTTCGHDKICFDGTCSSTPVICGDGVLISTSEECDDGNLRSGDGCENDCKKTCISTAPGRDCDNPCAIGAACDDGTSTCLAGEPVPDGVGCGTSVEPDRVCRGGKCAGASCGNGSVDAGEECDDANLVAGDGCESDCTFSCVAGDATRNCTLADPCLGTSTCNDTTHTCSRATPLYDGDPCGPAADGRVCISGVCTRPVCGNGVHEPGELCDDGNLVDDDGCKVDCTHSCLVDSDCSDALVCTQDICDANYRCANPPDTSKNGQPCAEGGISGGACQGGVCSPTSCGNAVVDSGEACDLGADNGRSGSGCTIACQYECGTDAACSDGNPCNGSETCVAVSGGKVCQGGSPLSTGAECGTSPARVCDGSRQCVASVCGDQIVDSRLAEQCDDGNTTESDGCKSDCTWTCTTAAACSDGNVCTDDVCSASHVCSNPASTAMNGQTCPQGSCQNGACVPAQCGNGTLETGEDCDNGSQNGQLGSGCTAACKYECAASADCSDGNSCNGTESCVTVVGGRTCQGGAPPAEGTVCRTNPSRRICRNQQCVASTCGDSFVDSGAGEACDKGSQNGVAGSGCTTACQYQCSSDAVCSDGNVCNGDETCATVSGGRTCQNGTAPATGFVCASIPRSICRLQTCQASTCGDGYVDPWTQPAEQCEPPSTSTCSATCQVLQQIECGNGVVDSGEQCDAGSQNGVAGSGCTSGCQYQCGTDASCSDGNVCNGAETCASVTGGKTCQNGTPPATGFVCGSSPRSICQAQTCQLSTCGDGYVDPGATPAEQCEPPSSGTCGATCQNITLCDLGGTWAVKITGTISWNGTTTIASGSGTVTAWALVTRTQSGATVTDVSRPCGIVIPDFRGSTLAGGETYGIAFPSSIFNSNTLPTATATGSFGPTATAGATFTSSAVGTVIGIDLPNAATATWPSASTASPADHDGDGKPGITAAAKTGSPYSLFPLNLLKSARADQLYLAVRQVTTFAGTLTSCTEQSGAVVISQQDALVLGCRTSTGGDCTTSQRDFLNGNRPVYNMPVNGTYTMVKVAASATCSTVRSTLP